MNLFSALVREIEAALGGLAEAGAIPAGLDCARITAEPPRDAGHGDVATNAAMVLAKQASMKPRVLAEIIAAALARLDSVEKAEVAGPGFINLTLTNAFWYQRLADINKAGAAYGCSDIGRDQAVNVEYVSANPTGPLHVGHARGAVIGDALAALLEKAGYAVTREYYINDAGAQVDTLARSLYLRYREALGQDIGDIPEGLYPGDYLKAPGAALAQRDGGRWLDAPEDAWLEPVRAFAIDAMMELIRDDLAAAGVRHDVFTSERALVAAGAVDEALAALAADGLIYTGVLEPPKGKTPDDWEERPQTLFRATKFGDDSDRPLKKSDGGWTYFATDIAYHRDKFKRGTATMVDVWGADHGGYVKRMKAAVKALTGGAGELDVKLCQMVNLMDAGLPVKMSKRAGTFVTLRDVIDAVGKDVMRFIMLTRKNDAQMDFDFARVTEQSRDNPVFYVQYAHARACSVLRHAANELGARAVSGEALMAADPSPLTNEHELNLIKTMAAWPGVVESAALAHEPHRVAFFLHDLAAAFHALWNKGTEDTTLRFLLAQDLPKSQARLAMLQAMRHVIASGLAVMGVEPLEELR